jgi:hypothetical protein
MDGDVVQLQKDQIYPAEEDDVLPARERWLGPLCARQRLGIEQDHKARIFGCGLNFVHPENW